MNATREAEELVRLWQELQQAQVAGDAARLEALRVRAEAQARRPDASREWELLAREAGKHSVHVHEAREAQPTASQRPSSFARSTSRSPAGCMRPLAMSDSARSRFRCDQLLRLRRGVKRWRRWRSSKPRESPSIQPKQSAISTDSS